jgi:polysaccharide export outer membrane protein
MRNRLSPVVIAVVGLGLFITDSVLAQKPAGDKAQNEKTNANRYVLVLGAVQSPARYLLEHPLRLAEAIAMAGGARAGATEIVQVIHAAASNRERAQVELEGINGRAAVSQSPPAMDFYKLSQLPSDNENVNPYLQPGDVVLVVESVPIYVIGNVLAPQALDLRARITLTRAIAMAGGVLPDSNMKRVRVFRSKPDSARREIIVDLNLILKGGEDLILEPFDIVEVPRKR